MQNVINVYTDEKQIGDCVFAIKKNSKSTQLIGRKLLPEIIGIRTRAQNFN